MSPQDAAKILAAFAAAYGKTVDEPTAQVWYQSTLRAVDYDLALKVADRIVVSDQWFPTPARFSEVRRVVERDQVQPFRALPSAPNTNDERERVQQIIDDTREQLRAPKHKREDAQ